LDIDGAYFGTSFPHVYLKTYPELYPKEGPVQYIPTIYGFKIFGQKGSKYELTYDLQGGLKNQKDIDNVLKKKSNIGGSTLATISGAPPQANQGATAAGGVGEGGTPGISGKQRVV
jgi:hypothetical protein